MRAIPTDANYRMCVNRLREAIAADRAAGMEPFCVIGAAGTVKTGAIDDLQALAALCREEGLWFHVDGAFGGLCVLDETLRPRVRGIEQADSIGFDFHKWMHVPYDAGCILVRNADVHREAFTMRADYLQAAERGLAGGGEWPCDFGPDLSRGFRALKIWFALKEHGAERIGAKIRENCEQAQYLAGLVRREADLCLLAEPTLNIVCFRYQPAGLDDAALDALNRDIVADVQEAGIAAPSTAVLQGRLAIRCNITNHRSRREDFRILVDAVLAAGSARMARKADYAVS
jgi:glutamate/tyrosine decarboxylase-like PLP-dependent enzyme